jgi:toxin ParE1/3/4
MKVRYTDRSRDELKAIQTYISRDSARAAQRIVRGIRAAVRQLKSFPRMGSILESWERDDVLELIVGNYRVVYQLTAREVWIITIVHAARRLPEPPED